MHPETNHYHWILDTPETNLVRGMGWFQNTCTCRFNHRHRLWGGLGLGMEALGLSDPDIRKQVRGDLRCVAVAEVLDSRTTVGQTWIAGN